MSSECTSGECIAGYSPLAGGDYVPPAVLARADPCRFDFGIKRKMDFFSIGVPGNRNAVLSATPPSGYYWWLMELSGIQTPELNTRGLGFFLADPHFAPNFASDPGINVNAFLNPLQNAIRIGSGVSAVGGAGNLFSLIVQAGGAGDGEGGALLANRIVVPPGWRIFLVFEDVVGDKLTLRMTVLELKLSVLPPRLQR